MNTGIAAVVAFVLVAFYVSAGRWDLLDLAERLAVIFVLGIVVVVMLAKPVQYLVADDCGAVDYQRFQESRYEVERCGDRNGNKATELALVPTSVFVVVVAARTIWHWLRRP